MASQPPFYWRLARRLLRQFPGLKGVLIKHILNPWVRWRAASAHQSAAGINPAAMLHAPGQELRLLKLEGALHLQRVGASYRSHQLNSTQPQGTAPQDDQPKDCLLIDVRITQISQRERGIPRYTAALALALPAQMPYADVAYLIDPNQPPPDALSAMRACGRIVNGPAEIASLPHVSHYLLGCLFELHKEAHELFPPELGRFKPQLLAIVYDLIPWLFPQHYLGSPYIAERYAFQFSLLPEIHHLFAISESARQDVIRLAHLPPSQVTNIYGGIDETRWASPNPKPAQSSSPSKEPNVPSSPLALQNTHGEAFSLPQPYWLYVGGADFRKNLPGLVKAFALFLKDWRQLNPTDLVTQQSANQAPHQTPSLVVACALDEPHRKSLGILARSNGLRPGQDIVLTGHISDATLAHCYQNAFATIFPSFYEGLGLPVLESYHFGVPALASGVSSMLEVTPASCQFDPNSEASIAQAMLRMHQQPTLRQESLAFGQHILQQCNWQSAASKIAQTLIKPAHATLPNVPPKIVPKRIP